MQSNTSYQRSLTSRFAQAVGDGWEQEINLQMQNLRNRGIAVIHKTTALTRVTGKSATGPKLSFVGPGPCDYIGAAAGLPIGFEAKSTAEMKTFHVPNDRLHQWEFLRDMLACNPGSFVGYLIEWRSVDRVCWHPFNGEKSFRWAEGILLRDRKVETAIRWHLQQLS